MNLRNNEDKEQVQRSYDIDKKINLLNILQRINGKIFMWAPCHGTPRGPQFSFTLFQERVCQPQALSHGDTEQQCFPSPTVPFHVWIPQSERLIMYYMLSHFMGELFLDERPSSNYFSSLAYCHCNFIYFCEFWVYIFHTETGSSVRTGTTPICFSSLNPLSVIAKPECWHAWQGREKFLCVDTFSKH